MARKKKAKKNVLLGICAGISAYKSCELARLLVKEGFSVKVIMTDNACRFVSPLVFQTLTTQRVYLDMFELPGNEVGHISLAQWADCLAVAPLTANTLSKIASGICDNLLTTVVCSLPPDKKVILSPAMNKAMWDNPVTAANVKKLKGIGNYIILDPQEGELACGTTGKGRMPEPEYLFSRIKSVCKK